jgi:prophage maintenance system killer protein
VGLGVARASRGLRRGGVLPEFVEKFLTLNGHSLKIPADDAVETMLAIAAGDLDEAAVYIWLGDRIDRPVE